MPRADCYHLLAEALAEPPDWLAGAGREWPLFEAVVQLAPASEAARRAVEPLAQVPAESLARRRKRYAELFHGPGRPRLWPYESAFLGGRVLGPETRAVERSYRAAGVDHVGAELPDHASLEVAFLAHLAAGGHAGEERQFLKQHAGRWLPQLGEALAHSGDDVYAPIGRLLAGLLMERASPRPAARDALPALAHADGCSLCGFCAQVCPTRALRVSETQSETALVLSVEACARCGKCERVCETGALRMVAVMPGQAPATARGPGPGAGAGVVLRRSPRVACRKCGAPTVSRAELDFVAARIGQPAWLEHCADCRQLAPHWS